MINKDKARHYKIREENAKLKKQLAIAVEALNEYADTNHWCGYFGVSGYEKAEEALKQIEELNK